MNLPEWVDPTSPDDPRAAPAAPGREGAGLPLGVEDPELADKPVLEWTKDDWARWVLGGMPATGTEAADAEPVGDAGAEPAAPVEVEVEAEPAAPVEVEVEAEPAAPVEVEVEARTAWGPDGQGRGEVPAAWPASAVVGPPEDHHVGPVDDDGPPRPIVDIRLPEEDDLLVPPTPLPGHDAGWDPPEPAADLGAEEGELRAGAVEQPDEDRPWDDGIEFDRRADLWAGQGAAAGADGAAEPDDEAWAGPPGDRWSGARSAATALDPDTLAIPVASPEEAMAALAPASAAWPTGIADPPGDQAPAAAAPARRAGGGWSRLEAEPVEDDRSRRVRSLIGLLCLAVTVGVLIAALITVTIVALGLALRRSVG